MQELAGLDGRIFMIPFFLLLFVNVEDFKRLQFPVDELLVLERR